MTSQSLRTSAPDPQEPTAYTLGPVQGVGTEVLAALLIRCGDDGGWRGRLRFTESDEGGHLREERLTAEIFCGTTEADLWLSVHSLGEHHIRDLYRSLG